MTEEEASDTCDREDRDRVDEVRDMDVREVAACKEAEDRR